MLAAIEQAILSRLKEKGLAVKHLGVGDDAQRIALPAAFCRIEAGRYTRGTLGKFNLAVNVDVFVEVEQLRDEASRRDAAYALVEALVDFLMLQDLGLAITPLAPVEFGEGSSGAGNLMYRVRFSTSFTVTKELPVAPDLTDVILEYWVQEADGGETLAASDELTGA